MQVAELMVADEDHIINVQGDEPLMPISVINALIEKLQALPTLKWLPYLSRWKRLMTF